MEWNLTLGETERDLLFSPSDTFLHVFGRQSRGPGQTLCSFRFMPLTSPCQTASFYDFFPMWEKNPISFFRPWGEGFLVILLFQHVDNCPFYLCCLLCIFWSCKDKKLYLLFKLLLLKYCIYVGQWSLLTSWCLRIKWTYISDYIILWHFYRKKHSTTSFQN